MYAGAGFVVSDSTRDIMVVRVGSGSAVLGEFALMQPVWADSATFLFHNEAELFPDEPDTVNLGTFPKGTNLVFRYIVTDTSDFVFAPYYRDVPAYSGQNRPGIDKWVAEVPPTKYGLAMCVAGRSSPETLIAGIEDLGSIVYVGIIFEVHGCDLEVVEKYKTSRPVAGPAPADTHSFPVEISLHVPYAGNVLIFGADTVDLRPDSSDFAIRYTLDGTDPREAGQRYDGPITLDSPATIAAYAYVDAQAWYPSDTVQLVYSDVNSAVRSPDEKAYFGRQRFAGAVYSLDGRYVAVTQASRLFMQPGNRGKLGPGVFVMSGARGGRSAIVARGL